MRGENKLSACCLAKQYTAKPDLMPSSAMTRKVYQIRKILLTSQFGQITSLSKATVRMHAADWALVTTLLTGSRRQARSSVDQHSLQLGFCQAVGYAGPISIVHLPCQELKGRSYLMSLRECIHTYIFWLGAAKRTDLRQEVEKQMLPGWRKQPRKTAWWGLKGRRDGIRLKWSQLGEEQKHFCLPGQRLKAWKGTRDAITFLHYHLWINVKPISNLLSLSPTAELG